MGKNDALKEAKKKEKLAIKNEKRRLEEKMDILYDKLKETKDKTERQSIKKEIKELQQQRANVGKKDTFISDVKAEMRLVRWPSKGEVVKYSIACIIFVAFFALFFYGIDALFALVKGLIK